MLFSFGNLGIDAVEEAVSLRRKICAHGRNRAGIQAFSRDLITAATTSCSLGVLIPFSTTTPDFNNY